MLVVSDHGILFGVNLPCLRLQRPGRGMRLMLGLVQLEIGVKMLAIGATGLGWKFREERS